MEEQKENRLLAHISYQAAKLPIIYFILGCFLVALSYLDTAHIFHYEIQFDLANKLGTILIVLAAVTFLYNLAVMVCIRYEKGLIEKNQIASIIIASLRRSLSVVFVLVAINIIITVIAPSPFYLNLAHSILTTLIICAIAWIILQVLNTTETVLYQKMVRLTRDERMRVQGIYTRLHIIRNIATVVIIIITIAAILMSFSSVRNIGISLLASAGFLTAIVGLASQKTLGSIFSGVQLALSHALKIGDIVEIEKISGMVEEITFTYVILKLGDKRRLIVPINYFIEKPFENWSRESGSMHSSLHIFTDYLLPIGPLREALDKILQESKLWDGKAQKLEISNLTERAVELRIQVSAASSDDLASLRAEVREKLLEFIREHYPEHFPQFRFQDLNKPT